MVHGSSYKALRLLRESAGLTSGMNMYGWSERGREREREDFRHSLRFVNLFCLVLRVFSAASKLQEATT